MDPDRSKQKRSQADGELAARLARGGRDPTELEKMWASLPDRAAVKAASEVAVADVFDRVWRPRIQALKLVDGYHDRWTILANRIGSHDLEVALATYRAAVNIESDGERDRLVASRSPTVRDAVHELSTHVVSVDGVTIGPLDPDDPSDHGLGPSPELHKPDPWAAFGRGAITVLSSSPIGLPPPSALSPFVLALLDLQKPDAEIVEDLKRLRRTYGTRPTTRSKRRSGDWGLEQGLRVLFELRADADATQESAWRRVAREMGNDPSAYDSRAVRTLVSKMLRPAKALVQSMAAAFEADVTSEIPKPPGLMRPTL